MKILNIQRIVFIIYGIGLILDHLTTTAGISVFRLQETNQLTFSLIRNGLWMYLDILLFISIILIIRLYWYRLTTEDNNIILVFPFISGFVRIIAGIWNIVILLNI